MKKIACAIAIVFTFTFTSTLTFTWLVPSVHAALPIETPDSLQTKLQATLQKRLLNDRSGVCMTVAIIAETKNTIKATACANPKSSRKFDDSTAFEIGSITKTMTATLLADLIERGQMKLDAPLADYLPAGTNVPSFEGKPILLRHVVTHTSGLPSMPIE